jgi:NAD(P)-dependent dehydrogenase (short-subunit alcohol dehydrogenase family)
MNIQLDGRVAIVTGAATGLGRAIANGLRDAGARVVGAGLLAGETPEGDWRTVNIRNPGEVDALFDGVSADYGSVDIVVNNAGLQATPGSSIDVPIETWLDIIDTNVNGTWYCCRGAIRTMLRQPDGGAIVNISSRLGLSAGGPGRAAYVTSKAAVSNLTRHLAVEYGREGIRVNAVCPGFVPDTGASITRDPDKLEEARRQTPAPRLGLPADIASAVVYLASPAAQYVNGHNLVIDGGVSVKP